MNERHSKLFSPWTINTANIPNRFVLAPMTRISATFDGSATERMAAYYERFAKGGFGLLISEGLYIDQAYSQGYQGQPGLSDEAQARAWQPVLARVHAGSALMFAQLMHAGALTQHNRFKDHTQAPSAVQPKGEQMGFYHGSGRYPVPEAMDADDIATVVTSFADAAARAIDIAGFDGIELHGANGYLLDEFLTDYTNLRDDAWGQGLQGRLALVLEVIAAVRAQVGPQVPLGVRLSQGKVNDLEHKWPEAERAAEIIFSGVAAAGVDFIHITEHKAWAPAFPGGDTSLVNLARRYAPGVTLIANGALHDPERASASLEDGADLIAIGKGALANPDLPAKIRAQQPLAEFDGSVLGPIADIKDRELSA